VRPVELIRCPNCALVYGDVQDDCPTCGADSSGEGAEIEFDGATRAAIVGLGGLYGGILEAPGDAHLLWCERGVCLVDATGLAWKSRVSARVEAVVFVGGDGVRVTTGRGEVVLGLQDGYPL